MNFGDFARRRALLAVLLCYCLLAIGCVGSQRSRAPVAEPLPPPTEQTAAEFEPEGVLHIVQPGETLWRIARTYGVELEELAAANGITDPAVLQAGRPLLVPGAPETLRVPPAATATTLTPGSPDFIWPVRHGRFLSGFGAARRGHSHTGIDIGAGHGMPVLAALAGRVTYAGSTMRGYGKTLILMHGSEFSSLYAHNSRLLVGEGDWVDRGQEIARIGRTGNASTDHCHFEIRRRGVAIDPVPYLEDGEEKN